MGKQTLLRVMCGVALTCLLAVAPANATTVWYNFTIDASDLMSYVLADGSVGDTAIDAGLDEGARLRRDGSSATDSSLRSYWESTNDAFQSWADSTSDRLVEFNIWGYDGNGANWGEFYKVEQWGGVPTSDDANWDGYITPWPWGSFDAYADGKVDYGTHYNEGQLLGWDTDLDDSDNAASYAAGMGFGDSSYPTFSFTLGLNDEDMFFSDGGWHDGNEGELALWFGGYTMHDDYTWGDLYEGNIVLTGVRDFNGPGIPGTQPVPEPASMTLLGLGLVGLGLRRYRKRG